MTRVGRPDGEVRLYVCPVGSVELERHVGFRVMLRARADARAEYAALKRRLARASADGEAYTAGTSTFHRALWREKSSGRSG